MGQTLTHGVYLPSEGERNCYSGLAVNWRLLDGAIGTVAAHTTAIAGKADISHTHGNISNDGKIGTTANLPLITGTGGAVQAGSFGTSANTFCEGNDSRLSDARTPVAHTHTKSDVTDLLNSNFIPSANNSYNLGSSSYQWNNLYAKSYYYNGVAWGLDKNNIWTTYNIFTGHIRPVRLRGSDDDTYNVQPQSTVESGISFVDKDNTPMSYIAFQHRADATETHRLCLRQNRPTESGYYSINLNNLGNFYPENTNTINLGTSTNQWKTLNGINPGALSLPDLNTAQTIDRTGWAYDGSTYNSIKLSSTDTNMTKNGWLYVRISSTGSSDKLSIKYNSIGDKYPISSFGDTGGCIEVFVPVIANLNVYLCATKDLQFCKFYPCLGNVPSGV